MLIAHHKESEERLILDGYGLYRKEFMYNDFVLVGPKSDPAGVEKARSIVTSLKLIKEKMFLYQEVMAVELTQRVFIVENDGFSPKP